MLAAAEATRQAGTVCPDSAAPSLLQCAPAGLELAGHDAARPQYVVGANCGPVNAAMAAAPAAAAACLLIVTGLVNPGGCSPSRPPPDSGEATPAGRGGLQAPRKSKVRLESCEGGMPHAQGIGRVEPRWPVGVADSYEEQVTGNLAAPRRGPRDFRDASRRSGYRSPSAQG
jgi:hypothetical protein